MNKNQIGIACTRCRKYHFVRHSGSGKGTHPEGWVSEGALDIGSTFTGAAAASVANVVSCGLEGEEDSGGDDVLLLDCLVDSLWLRLCCSRAFICFIGYENNATGESPVTVFSLSKMSSELWLSLYGRPLRMMLVHYRQVTGLEYQGCGRADAAK